MVVVDDRARGGDPLDRGIDGIRKLNGKRLIGFGERVADDRNVDTVFTVSPAWKVNVPCVARKSKPALAVKSEGLVVDRGRHDGVRRLQVNGEDCRRRARRFLRRRCASSTVSFAEEGNVEVLLSGRGSVVELETVAVFVTCAEVLSASSKIGADRSSLRRRERCRSCRRSFRFRRAAGVLQMNCGPDVCVHDANVLPDGMASVSVTPAASLGPAVGDGDEERVSAAGCRHGHVRRCRLRCHGRRAAGAVVRGVRIGLVGGDCGRIREHRSGADAVVDPEREDERWLIAG